MQNVPLTSPLASHHIAGVEFVSECCLAPVLACCTDDDCHGDDRCCECDKPALPIPAWVVTNPVDQCFHPFPIQFSRN